MTEPGGYDDAVLPEQSSDDSDAGWGDLPDPEEDERLLREKPPHY